MIKRETAIIYLQSLVDDVGLLAHCFAVEAVMLGLAKRAGLGMDEQTRWGIAGLVHDADWQAFPSRHPYVVTEWLRLQGEPEIAEAVAAHGVCFGMPHKSKMSRALVASDELTGFIMAYSRVRPSGLIGLDGRAVAKKLKTPSFAAGVSRAEVYEGVKILGTTVELHAQTIIEILIAKDMQDSPEK